MPEGLDQEERTEPATQRRREEARKKGQVARSVELTSAFMFLVGLIAVWLIFPSIFSEIINITNFYLSYNGRDKTGCEIWEATRHASWITSSYGVSTLIAVGKAFAPFALLMLGSALLIGYAQVGFFVSGETIAPKFERIDPIKGFSRLISKRTIVSFAQSVLKVAIVTCVLYITMKGEQNRIANLADMQIKPAISQIIALTFKMGSRAAILLFVLAASDYAYQRWEYERSLRMTRQEVKEEMRQTEGDPLVRARIRSIQREMAMRRMMQEVPKADVVITNPTHIAVALRYRQALESAPRVCAKGMRLIAERIKAIAREYNIPIIEDKPLAHTLYKLKLGQEIPFTLYKAVAEILARVYQMNRNAG